MARPTPDAAPVDAAPADAVPCVVGAKRIFVTSTAYSGNLKAHAAADSGLEGGDALCELHASAAGLGGTWKAWLSAGAEDAIDRMADVGTWYTVDGCQKIFHNKASIVTTGAAGRD